MASAGGAARDILHCWKQGMYSGNLFPAYVTVSRGLCPKGAVPPSQPRVGIGNGALCFDLVCLSSLKSCTEENFNSLGSKNGKSGKTCFSQPRRIIPFFPSRMPASAEERQTSNRSGLR